MNEIETISLSSMEGVKQFERLVADLPQVDLQTQMLVHGQMAARALFLPAGTLATGALTNIDNIGVISGDVTVTTPEGDVRLTGFNILAASAGFKRAAYAHSDTWWVTIHHTELTDLADIEAEMTDEADKLQTRRLALAAARREVLK